MRTLPEFRDYPSLFHSRDAAMRGITDYGLRNDPRFSRVITGVRLDGRKMERHLTPPWSGQEWMDESVRLRAATMLIPGVIGGHLTAARLFGLPLPNSLIDSHLHLISPEQGKHVFRRGITVHRRALISSGPWLGLPMCAPPELLIDLAAVLTLEDLVAAGDAMVGNWHGPPLCSLSFLRQGIEKHGYLRNRGRVEQAVGLIRETVDSPREADLRLWCRARGLPEPTVHPRVSCRLNGRIAEPDLGFEAQKLALEYEGDHHRSSKQQWDNDLDRDEGLRFEGWEVLKVTSRTNRAALERKIRRHLGLRQT